MPIRDILLPMSAPHILLVTDLPRYRGRLLGLLSNHGYHVSALHESEQVHAALSRRQADLIIVVAPPNRFAVGAICGELRAISPMPLLVVLESESPRDKIEALDAGADDCLAAPFSDLELLAHIRVIFRRLQRAIPSAPQVLQFDGLVIDLRVRRVAVDGRTMRLTPKEFDLIRLLLTRSNQIVPYADLLRTVWGKSNVNQQASLRVFINGLRRKIERDPARPRFLLNEPRVGYRLRLPSDSAL